MLGLILIIAFWGILVVVLTSPSKRIESAEKAFAQGDMNKAEEYLRKVWTKRDDIPAHLAGMYFKLIKKDKLKYVHNALSINTVELSEEAKRLLKGVQDEIRKYLESRAALAFANEDYAEAIKYNESLIPFGDLYKNKDDEYRIYRDLKNFLSSGRKSPTLNTYINNNPALVVKCIKSKVRENTISLEDTVKILSIMLDNEEIRTLFDKKILKYVLELSTLPDLRAEADRYQLTYLESQADNMPEEKVLDALKIYKAINAKKPKVAIYEKIESLNFQRASKCIERGNYKKFQMLHNHLKQNVDVTPSFRFQLDCKYSLIQFDYLRTELLRAGLNDEMWEEFLTCCKEHGSSPKNSKIIQTAIDLNSHGSYGRSMQLCRLLNNSTPDVLDLICKNVINILEQHSEYKKLTDIYDNVEVIKMVADRCFEHAKKLAAEGNYEKALYIEKLTENYFDGDPSKYDIFITHYLIYVISCSKKQLTSEIDTIISYLTKVRDKDIVNKHLIALEDMAGRFMSEGKASEAYELSRRIFDISKQAARIFLDSALALAQKGQLKDSFGLSKAIGMQDDILGETLKFLPFFPQQLRAPYVTGYSRRVVELFKNNQEEAIDFYRGQEDLSLRNDILEEISRTDTSTFKAIAIDILKEPETRLPKGTNYATTVIRLISDIFTGEDKIVLLRFLVENGYDAKDSYVCAVIASIDKVHLLDRKLAEVNVALNVIEDSRLYAIKKDIAKAYATEDPFTALSICAEISSEVSVRDIEFECHIKIAETTDTLTEKHSHLSTAKKLCGNSSKAKYARIITLAQSLAKSLFVSGNFEEGYAVCEEFPCAETELLSLSYKFEGLKKIAGDDAASKELEILIGVCDSSPNATIIYQSDTYNSIWNEYVRRNLSKAAKQSAVNAVDTLLKVEDKLKNAHFDSSELFKILADNISKQSYTIAIEYEGSSDYEHAIKYYDIAIKYDPSNGTTASRRVLCYQKHGLWKGQQLKQEVDKTLGLLTSIADRVTFLKTLVVNGYEDTDQYVTTVLSHIGGIADLDEKLSAVNESLTVAEDKKLYELKIEIAYAYTESDPLRSLAICSEIEKKANVKEVQLACYIKLAEDATTDEDKHKFLCSAKQKCNKSNKKAYGRIAALALSLAKSLFASDNFEQGHAVCEEFPSIETELLSISYKFERIKKVAGDAAAANELKTLIDLCDSSSNATDIHQSDIYKSIWQEYSRRILSKASKQSADKAVATLIKVANEVKGAHFESNDLYKTLSENIAKISFDHAHELEESSDYKNAIVYYTIVQRYASSSGIALGRRVLCLIKQGTLNVPKLAIEVDKVINSVPREIEKDIVYRFVLRSLEEGFVTEATKLAEERLRDNKLLDLCQAYKLRKVQSQIDILNERLALIRDNKMSYDEAFSFNDELDAMMSVITEVFPEKRNLLSDYKKAISVYMLRMAQKEEKYDILYKHYYVESGDFIKDPIRFRNLAAACIGMIEKGALNGWNYKKVISIWLTAVYNDYLIVRSLDHTKWDDDYTFTLDDSLSQTYGYNDLPSNINYDSPSESNISIGQVQKSLMERSDAALSNGDKKYYDFYLEQIKAMKAYSEVKYKELRSDDTEENIIAPYAVLNILPAKYATRMKARLNSGNTEHGYRVGYLYGFTDKVFADYNDAITHYQECLSAANDLSRIASTFTKAKLSTIRKFRNLYEKFVGEITSILNKHINDGKTYKQLSSSFGLICKVIGNENLSYKFSEHINSQVIPLVNNDSLSTEDGLNVLYEVYKVCTQNMRLQQNVSGMLVRMVGDYLMKAPTAGWGTISKILNDTNDFNNAVLDFLSQDGLAVAVCIEEKQSRLTSILDLIKNNDPSVSSKVSKVTSSISDAKKQIENMKLQQELSEIVDQVNSNSMSGLTALQKVYAIYKKDKSDSRICENMAIIAERCMEEYIPSNQLGVSSVRTTLDELFLNRSTMFNSKRKIFRDRFNALKSSMTYEQQVAFGIIESSYHSHTTLTLTEEGKRIKLFISYLKKFAND